MKQILYFEINGKIEAENYNEAENLIRNYLNKKTINSLHIEFLKPDKKKDCKYERVKT